MEVRWNKSLSVSFNVSNGVRQGGVLSLILFSVYLDDLLKAKRCRKPSGLGPDICKERERCFYAVAPWRR